MFSFIGCFPATLLRMIATDSADEAALDESDSVIIEVTPTHVFSWGVE